MDDLDEDDDSKRFVMMHFLCYVHSERNHLFDWYFCSMTPSTRLKVDIRNEAIVENPSDAMNTMKKFASTLPTVPTTRRKGLVFCYKRSNGTRRLNDSAEREGCPTARA